VDPEAIGLPLTAFVSVTTIDVDPDVVPNTLAAFPEIEECHSVAGAESYVLKVRVQTPSALEHLLARIRHEAHVTTRTTVVLSTPWESGSRAS